MATTIQLKRGTGSAVPSGLEDGELAINLDNGKLYFGSGSTSINSFRFENLTAENYIVSSSVTNITTQTLSGSTSFGDSTDDTHQFTGAITASGAISASGNLLGGGITVNGNSHFNSNVIDLGVDSGDRINLNAYVVTSADFKSHITASGNISSSENIIGSNIIANSSSIASRVTTLEGVNHTNSALTVDNTTLQLNTGTTYNGAAARTISIKDGGVDSDALAAAISVTSLTTTNITASGIIVGNTNLLSLGDPDGNVGGVRAEINQNGTTSLLGNATLNLKGNVIKLIDDNGDKDARIELSGPVTASGDISASGTIVASNLSGTNTGDQNLSNLAITGSNVIFGNVTASGNISASGDIFADDITAADLISAGRFGSTGITSFGNSADDTHTFTGDITASGDISASNAIISQKLFLREGSNGGIIFDDDGAQTSDGSITLINNGINIFADNSNPAAASHLFVSQSGGTGMTHGKVGINTITPNEHLEVVGNISSSGTITAATLDAAAVSDTLAAAIVAEIDNDEIPIAKLAEDAVTVTAGTGLTGGGSITLGGSATVNVIGGTGVTANANDIAIGQDVATTANVQFANITSSANISASGNTHVFGNVTMNSGKTFIGNAIDESASENLLVVGGISGASIKLYSSHNGTNRDVGLHMSASENGQEYSIGLARARNSFYISPSDVFSGPENAVFEIDAVGNITASGNISSSGDIKANTFTAVGNVDFDGDLDVDGTTNLDIVDIDGAVDMASTLTVDGTVDIAGELQRSGDADTKIAFGPDIVSIKAGNTAVFESSVTGSVLSKVHQNVYDTGSLAISTANGVIGDIVKFGDSSTVAGGIYFLNSSGGWTVTQANAAATSTGSLAVAVGTNSTTHGMCLRGFVNPHTDPGAGIGSPVYLSDTNTGRMLATAPDSTNDVVRIVGYQYGTDLIYFNPSNDYIVHA